MLLIVAPIGSFLIDVAFRVPKTHQIIHDSTLDNYADFFGNWTYFGTFLGTLLLCSRSWRLSLLIGYPIAWFIWRQKGSRRYLLLLLAVVPLFMSYIVKLYTLRSMLGLNGLVNQMLLGLGILEKPSQVFLFNQRAVLITMVVIYLPFVDPADLPGARTHSALAAAGLARSGRQRLGHFRRVVLPLVAARHHRRRALRLRAGAGRFHHAADGRRHHRLHHRPRHLFAVRPCL